MDTDPEIDLDKLEFPPPNGPSAPFNRDLYDEENSIGKCPVENFQESTILLIASYKSHWVQNRLIINLWQQCIEGDREFKTKGIIGGGRWGYQCYQNYHLIEG